MGDGTKEKPSTREDVLRLIQENGGKAEDLELFLCEYGYPVPLWSLLFLFHFLLHKDSITYACT